MDEFQLDEFVGQLQRRHLLQGGEHRQELLDMFGRIGNEELFGIEQEDDPQKEQHADSRSGFIDLDDILEGNGQNPQ